MLISLTHEGRGPRLGARCSEASCLVSRYLVGVLLIRKCAGPLCAAWDDGETLVDLFISMLCFACIL